MHIGYCNFCGFHFLPLPKEGGSEHVTNIKWSQEKGHKRLKPLHLQHLSNIKAENYRTNPAAYNLNPKTAYSSITLRN